MICENKYVKKYKKLTFTFSLISLFGLTWALTTAYSDPYYFELAFMFPYWFFFSLPLIILFIWTKIFD